MKFFNYSGSKIKYVDIINEYINTSKSGTYVEPFVGSGAVFFNLEKQFDEYVINDLDENIIGIYKTFKKIDYQMLNDEWNFINKKFGLFKSNNRHVISYVEAKKNYYNFRNWFNEHHWKTHTTKEGIYCYFLCEMVINSFMRFSKSGISQSFGNRCNCLNETTFNCIHARLQKTKIFQEDYKKIFERYPNACYFLDPPYFSQKSSYDGFTLEEYKTFLSLLKNKEYVYTDIVNEHNRNLSGEFIRNMLSTAPGKNSHENKNNFEHIFSSLYKTNIRMNDW